MGCCVRWKLLCDYAGMQDLRQAHADDDNKLADGFERLGFALACMYRSDILHIQFYYRK